MTRIQNKALGFLDIYVTAQVFEISFKSCLEFYKIFSNQCFGLEVIYSVQIEFKSSNLIPGSDQIDCHFGNALALYKIGFAVKLPNPALSYKIKLNSITWNIM